MRVFDCNNVYFDLLNRPLKGRVHFFVKGTTTAKAIFGSDGLQLSNPVYTTNGKLAPQVFLDDADYSIMWESYVGDGDMRIDEDSHSWRQCGYAISLQPEVKTEITNFGLVCARNIAHLRTIDPAEITESMVTLLGYSSAGDKPAINYYWDSSSRESDNGSTVIKTTATDAGRFKMVIQEDLDIRHFGVFPADTIAQTTSEQALAIAFAHRVAVNYGINIFFPGYGEEVGYYRLNTGEINHFYCFDSSARFVAVDGVTITASQVEDHSIYFDQAQGYSPTVKIYGRSLRASFNVGHNTRFVWNASDRFFIDDDDQSALPDSFDAKNVIPVFDVAASKNYAFKGYTYLEGKKLPVTNSYTFEDCDFTDRLFASASSIGWSKVTLTNCIVNIERFQLVNNWLEAKKKGNSNDLDFCGKTISENVTIAFNGNCRLLNGTFTGSFSISNASGTTEISGCRFSSFATPTVLYKIVAQNSEINGTALLASNAEFDGCFIGGAIGSSDYPCSKIDAEGSSFGGKIYANVPVFRNCIFNDVVESYPESGTAQFFFQGNVFNTNAYHKISTECVMSGTWKGNIFNGSSSIIANGTPGAAHSVVYEDNVGSVPTEGVVDGETSLTRLYWNTDDGKSYYGVSITNSAEIELFGFGSYDLECDFTYLTETISVSPDVSSSKTLKRMGSISKKFQIPLYGKRTVSASVLEEIYDPTWSKAVPSVSSGYTPRVSYRITKR